MDDAELRAGIELHHAAAHAWARSCCRGHPDDAEEVLQTVYLMLLDGRATFEGRSEYRTWLFGVIRRTAAGTRRRGWIRRLLLDREADGVAPSQPVAASVATEILDRGERLRAALAHLSARQREVLDLVFYHDMTVEAAASVMGVTVGSARTHYARGKARLASLLTVLKDD